MLPPSSKIAALFVLLVGVGPSSTDAKGFLMDHNRSRIQDVKAFERELEAAMSEAMGCGGQIGRDRLDSIESTLLPLWKTLPKNGQGRIDRRALRYMAHRYFNQKSSLLLRGFEPMRPSNSSWGSDDILSLRVPAYVESVLQSRHAQDHGFDLKDAVRMVAALEQLIFDSDGRLLQVCYASQKKPISASFGAKGLQQVLEEYMTRWMLGSDREGIEMLLKKPEEREASIPHWNMLTKFLSGQVKGMDFQRQRAPRANSWPGHNALTKKYSFEDAHWVVGSVTQSFASFWESECADMKAALVQMDPLNTGRVPLSKFYVEALESEWRFGESESYLRDLGALDETSSWRGKQVIIPNYIQGVNNCIVSANHYQVCCVNECESMMREIEKAIGEPLASPDAILSLVGNMTSQTTVEHDDPPQIQGALTTQLEQIAAAHGGKVPLHGRLFAQWLHYAFPHECAFPSKAASFALAPHQYGNGHIATKAEMKVHVQSVPMNSLPSDVSKEELEWMSQWSEEEELFADYSSVYSQKLPSHIVMGGGVLFLVCTLLGVVNVGRGSKGTDSCMMPTQGRTHFV